MSQQEDIFERFLTDANDQILKRLKEMEEAKLHARKVYAYAERIFDKVAGRLDMSDYRSALLYGAAYHNLGSYYRAKEGKTYQSAELGAEKCRELLDKTRLRKREKTAAEIIVRYFEDKGEPVPDEAMKDFSDKAKIQTLVDIVQVADVLAQKAEGGKAKSDKAKKELEKFIKKDSPKAKIIMKAAEDVWSE